MDPLNAISLASCVVQFVDFAGRLFSEARDIYTSASGIISCHDDLFQFAKDLLKLSNEVETKSTSLGDGMSDSSKIFFRLCRECEKINTEIQAAISKLQVKGGYGLGRAARSFSAGIKGIWSMDNTIEMRRRLGDIREQMMMAILSLIL